MGIISITPGERFGKLVVIGYAGSTIKSGNATWRCVCDCGKEIVVVGTKLRRTNGRNGCGCFRKHGMCKTRTYSIWEGVLHRCRNANDPDYGGRGITVCERWSVFNNFLADMGECPSTKYEIDRIDNNGNYGPENCRWATDKEQHRNKRSNRLIEIDGVTRCLAEWADLSPVTYHTIKCRLRKGWSNRDAVWKPVDSRKRNKRYAS